MHCPSRGHNVAQGERNGQARDARVEGAVFPFVVSLSNHRPEPGLGTILLDSAAPPPLADHRREFVAEKVQRAQNRVPSGLPETAQ
jgi:hypothetical protein